MGLLVSALAFGGAPLPAASAAPLPRVMIVGDSVAHQYDGDYTWRYRVWREFQRQKAPVDFVGPFRWGYGVNNTYLGGKGWDSQHDAQGATRITDFLDTTPTPGSPNAGRFNITKDVATYRPDLIVSVLGTNDVNDGLAVRPSFFTPSIREQLEAEGRTPAVEARVDTLLDQVLANYAALLASARSVKPNLKIVVAEVTSQRIDPWIRDKVNAALAGLPDTSTSPLVVAPADDPKWALPGYTVDGIHPTPTGDMLMAQRVLLGIRSVWPAALKTSPKVPQTTVAWNPVLKPSIKVSGRRITLNWATSTRANTVFAVRVKFVNAQTLKTTYATYAHTTGWTSGVQKPGNYRVRLQGIRGNMTSTWSPAFPVKVPRG